MTVATPIKKVVADYDEYVGRFVAIDAVEVRARVSGYLDSISFKDGQLVKRATFLFTIDRRPFEAALQRGEATLEAGQSQPRLLLPDPISPVQPVSSLAPPSPSRRSTSACRPSG